MIKVDLNRIAIAGLVLGAIALALALYDTTREESFTVATILGPEAPLARVSIWMIMLVAAMLVYLLGRIIWLVRNPFAN